MRVRTADSYHTTRPFFEHEKSRHLAGEFRLSPFPSNEPLTIESPGEPRDDECQRGNRAASPSISPRGLRMPVSDLVHGSFRVHTHRAHSHCHCHFVAYPRPAPQSAPRLTVPIIIAFRPTSPIPSSSLALLFIVPHCPNSVMSLIAACVRGFHDFFHARGSGPCCSSRQGPCSATATARPRPWS